jgi:starvation-inducible outer membrane lipoprotein
MTEQQAFTLLCQQRALERHIDALTDAQRYRLWDLQKQVYDYVDKMPWKYAERFLKDPRGFPQPAPEPTT